MRTGSLGNFVQATYSYNHILVVFAAVALFYAFFHCTISAESRVGKLVCAVAPYTLGVYLLHEHVEIRWIWPTWLGASPQESLVMMFVRMLGSICIVFVLGILVDFLRGQLFRFVKVMWRKTSFYAKISSK